MTFMTTRPKSDIVSDAELARAAAAGDRAALAGIYKRYAAPLQAYCVGVVAIATRPPTACKMSSAP